MSRRAKSTSGCRVSEATRITIGCRSSNCWRRGKSSPFKISALKSGYIGVADLLATGQVEPVYNLRVADYHTYFVGRSLDAPWSVWAHNAYTAAQLQKNKVAGKAAEAAARAWFNAKGIKIVAEQAHVITSKGRRVVDFIVRVNGKLLAYEIKSGNARRTLLQGLKDEALALGGGTWQGKELQRIPTMPLYF